MKKFMLVILLCSIIEYAQAGEMTHFFVNPAFGGNPLNTTHLMSTANAINDYQAPKPATTTTPAKTPSTSELFSQQVDRLVMSMLASRLVNQAFGTDNSSLPEKGAQIDTGINIVTVSNTINGTEVKIVDKATGSEATIQVPQF